MEADSGCEMGARGGKPCLVQVVLSTCLSDCLETLSCDQIMGLGVVLDQNLVNAKQYRL